MLKGEAKRDYMREYMRRRRAGQRLAPQPHPHPTRTKPTQRMLDQIRHWGRLVKANRTEWLRAPSWQVIDGLDLDTDEGMAEACRRYRANLDERRKQREAEKAAPPPVKRCSFCGEPRRADRLLVGDGWAFICEHCVAEAVAAIAAERGTKAAIPGVGDLKE